MRVAKISLSVLVALLVVGLLLAPIGPVPGVFIGGTAATPPASWPDTADVDEIRLGVAGTIPRVVIIWVVDVGGELHVVGSRDSGWVKMIGDTAPVKMRLGDHTYPLRAVRITAGFEDILKAYIAKYEAEYPEIIASFPSLEDARDSVGVFRLERN
jgi:hypothetical protein